VALWGSGASDIAPMTATPHAPASITSSTDWAVMPAMATTGTGTAEATARTPATPMGSGSPLFDLVANVGPTPR
jgi:hypothetical protein